MNIANSGIITISLALIFALASGCAVNNISNDIANENHEVGLMDSAILEQIREKTIGANKDTTFDIREVKTSISIEGVGFLMASHQFHIDPTPWDNWIVDNGKVRPGSEILDVLKEKEFVPSSKDEAIEAAKLVLKMENREIRIYPDFNAEGCKKPSAVEKDGAYEATLYVSHGFYYQPPMPVKAVFRIGKGVYELKTEMMLKK